MKFLKKISGLNKLKGLSSVWGKKVKWDYKFGLNKKNYELVYVSEFMDSKMIERLFGYIMKHSQAISYSDLIEDEWFELPSSTFEDYEKQILTIFPKIVLKKPVDFVSQRLDSLFVYKSKKGFRVKGILKGLIK